MPWEKRFDEDSVLEAAMTLFWERGYKGVSMTDLVDTLGVSRSSLYDTFGQKEDLFRSALLRYDRIHRQEWLTELGARFDPIESIRQAFEDVIEAPEEQRRFGCLLVNATLDVPLGEREFADLVRNAFDATEAFFQGQLEEAVARGELPADTNCPALAASLLAMFLGLRVLTRAQRRAETIYPILDQVNRMLVPSSRNVAIEG